MAEQIGFPFKSDTHTGLPFYQCVLGKQGICLLEQVKGFLIMGFSAVVS